MSDPTPSPSPTPAPNPAQKEPAAAQPAPGATPSPTPSPAAAAAPPNVLAGAAADDVRQAAPATWPADWRDKLAGGDAKLRTRLERFQDPGAILTSFTQLEARLSSGGLKPVAPGKDATAEEVAAFRKDAGVPEKPEGYLEALDKGLVLGDDDKALLGKVLVTAHDVHAPPAVVKAMVESYLGLQEGIVTDQRNRDVGFKQETEEALRADWGADYRRNINVVSGFLETVPPGVKDAILGGRRGDGRALAADPVVVKWLLGVAHEINPAVTVVPGAGAGAGKGMLERKAEIETMMRKDRRAYNKDAGVQDEYRRILAAIAKQGGKAA